MNLTYDKILSDLCPGIIAAFIIGGIDVKFPEELISLFKDNEVIILGVLLIIMACFGKLLNLIGYLLLSWIIDYLTYKVFRYGSRIQINSKNDYMIIKRIRCLVENYYSSYHNYDFKTEEGLKRLVRTLTVISLLLACYYPSIIILCVPPIVLSIAVFLQRYMYNKYIQHAIIIVSIHRGQIYDCKRYELKSIENNLCKILKNDLVVDSISKSYVKSTSKR